MTTKLESRLWLVLILTILVIGQVRLNSIVTNNNNASVRARHRIFMNQHQIIKQLKLIEARIAAIRIPAASGR
jgi:hypothetical protein